MVRKNSHLMNAKARTVQFVKAGTSDRPPVHPLLMRSAARYAGILYRDFCLNPEAKVEAMSRCTDDFGLDWITVLSDPFSEAEAYGLQIDYPEDNLPQDRNKVLNENSQPEDIPVLDINAHRRLRNRVREIELFRKRYGQEMFIVGWVEGPFAEYADLRGLSDACIDLYDDSDKVCAFAERLTDNAIRFAEAQIKAGADCVGIGDAACSQINTEMYRELFQPLEKRMVERIQNPGALAKLHICGNTSHILPDMIRTGADIIDVDHLAGSMRPFASLLQRGQVFSGNIDPVRVVQEMTPAQIRQKIFQCMEDTGGRCIVSAGCEITPDTSPENLRALRGEE
jgi:MtaA/CmuA family methyltransferase